MSLLKKLSNAAFVLNCLKIIGLLMGMVTHAPLLVPRTRCRARCCRPCRRTGLTEQVHEAPGSAAAFLRKNASIKKTFTYVYIRPGSASTLSVISLLRTNLYTSVLEFQLFAVWLARRYRNQPDPNYKEPHAIFPRQNYLY
ncbi:unnamed protein product [Plutella xylostella]|uniref:(diamondback moth) hypothetical protein n=1 Tax=Plutella xylostella TaxID=51655 RepID=A0A8S4G621_PLUXY|nr:unnamed protein product [Plutella xylostella]